MVFNITKPLLLVVSLFSVSVAANSTSASLQKQSVAKRVVIKVDKQMLVDKNSMLEVQMDNKGISVSRRQTAKKQRPAVKLIEKIETQKYRAEQPQTSDHSFGFEIFDSWVTFDSDVDGDGYFSEFTLDFDADFSDGAADVYAVIYTRLDGGTWTHLYTSDDFSIYLTDANDYFSVSFGLNNGFPPGEYDLLIDLYEVGYSGIVATAGPVEDFDLYALPLEDSEYDSQNEPTLITYVASELFSDHDHDGFYTQLTLEFDIDTYDSGRLIYAEVDIINTEIFERSTVITDNFILGNHTEFIDIDFSSGYIPSYYDIEIRLIDVYSGEILAYAAQDFSSLSQLPIESEEYEHSNVDLELDVHVSGGGSLGWGLLLIALLAIQRKR